MRGLVGSMNGRRGRTRTSDGSDAPEGEDLVRAREPQRGDFEAYGALLGTRGLEAAEELFEAARQVESASFREALFEGFATSTADVDLGLSASGYMAPLGAAAKDLLEAQRTAALRYLLKLFAAGVAESEAEEYLESTRQRRETLRSLLEARRSTRRQRTR
jgi:hypothetical protein